VDRASAIKMKRVLIHLAFTDCKFLLYARRRKQQPPSLGRIASTCKDESKDHAKEAPSSSAADVEQDSKLTVA